MKKRECFYATLAVYSDSLDVGAIAALVGLRFDRCVQKGEGLALGRVAPHHGCFYETRRRKTPEGLSKELVRLASKVHESLAKIDCRDDLIVRVWVFYPGTSNFNYSVFLGEDVVACLAALRSSLTIDFYA